MKYIYYTIGILLLLTVILVFPFKKLKVEVSKPALVINDRVVTQGELDRLLQASNQSNHTAGVIDAVITNELLIQEALAQGINREESFRASVESFYEQSLIKTLIDRKFADLDPQIPQSMVDRFAMLEDRNLVYSIFMFDSRQEVEQGKTDPTETVNAAFDDLSDELKYILVQTNPGELSDPVKKDKGFVCYTLESEINMDTMGNNAKVPEKDEIREFLIQQKKRIMFARWIDDLIEKAQIKVLTDLPAVDME